MGKKRDAFGRIEKPKRAKPPFTLEDARYSMDPRSTEEVRAYLYARYFQSLAEQGISDVRVTKVLSIHTDAMEMFFVDEMDIPVHLEASFEGVRNGKRLQGKLKVYAECYLNVECQCGRSILLPFSHTCSFCGTPVTLGMDGEDFTWNGSVYENAERDKEASFKDIESLTGQIPVVVREKVKPKVQEDLGQSALENLEEMMSVRL